MNQRFSTPVSPISKTEKYQALLPQLRALVSGEPNMIANLANLTAALKEAMGFFWVGFYIVDRDHLVLGPFQGPVACTRISKGKGVCGTAWLQKKPLIVPDVEKFPGHISCSAEARSEIVIPVIAGEQVQMVLDVDSNRPDDFDETDKQYLQTVCSLIVEQHYSNATN